MNGTLYHTLRACAIGVLFGLSACASTPKEVIRYKLVSQCPSAEQLGEFDKFIRDYKIAPELADGGTDETHE